MPAMKRTPATPLRITLFVLSIIALLALLCWFFPASGLTIGSLTLRFPALTDYFPADTVLQISSADTAQTPGIANSLSSTRTASAGIANSGIANSGIDNGASSTGTANGTPSLNANETPFVFPEPADALLLPRDSLHPLGDSSYLQPFYAALLGADTLPVHLVHYGDSQIEEDRITSVLRTRLQTQFGGGGVGLIPLFQSVPTLTLSQTTSPVPTRYLVYGSSAFRHPSSHQYGPMGQVALLDSVLTLSLAPRSKQPPTPSQYFSRLTLLTSSDSPITLSALRHHATAQPNETLALTTLSLPDSTTSLTLSLRGHGSVYGVLLDNANGVSVDNIPMRGCSGTVFTAIQSAQLRTYFAATHTRLILLQYGGNNVPYMPTEQKADEYVSYLLYQIRYLRRQAPQAAIVFIGPSDMSVLKQGQWTTYPLLPYLDARLAQACTSNGIAYWSLFHVMGGSNTMPQWVAKGFAGRDHIHFTKAGAAYVGDCLYKALLSACHSAPPGQN